MYHDTAVAHHQQNCSTILIEVLPQLTELCYDNLIQMKMHADNSPISSLVWVLIIWQLKEPHTFNCRFHLYPQTCLQCLQAGCHAIMLIRFLLPQCLKSDELHEIPINTQHCCGHDRLKANMNRPDQSDWAKRWNSSGFVHSLGSCHENDINLVIYTVYCILLVRPHVPAISLIERPIMWYLSPLPMRGMTLYDHVDTFVRIRAMSDDVAGNDGWFIPQIR